MGDAAWFVDGAYLFEAWKSLGRPERFDYLKLRRYLETKYCNMPAGERIVEAYYLSADPDPPTAAQSSFNKFLSVPPPDGPGLRVKLYWLQKKELRWPRKLGGLPVIHPETGEHYELTTQKGVDVGLAFNLIRSYQRKGWNRLFLCAGDGDFHEVAQYLVEQENIDLYIVGTAASISSELRPYSKHIIDLAAIANEVARPAQATQPDDES